MTRKTSIISNKDQKLYYKIKEKLGRNSSHNNYIKIKENKKLKDFGIMKFYISNKLNTKYAY